MKETIKKFKQEYTRFFLLQVCILFAVIAIAHRLIENIDGTCLSYVLITGGMLLAFCFISFRHYSVFLQKSPSEIARFYLVHLAIRFLLGGVFLAAARIFLTETERKPGMICFGAFFLWTLIADSFLFVRIEKKLNDTTLLKK